MKTHGYDARVTSVLTQMYKFACLLKSRSEDIVGNEMLLTLLCYKT